MSPIEQLKKKLKDLANQGGQTVNQVSRSIPQPIKSFVKPIAQGVTDIATKQIPSYQRVIPLTQMTQNPIGFMGAAKQQIQNFQQNKPQQAAMNVGKDIFNSAKLGANVYGGSKMLAGGAMSAAKTIIPNAAIGGGLNKVMGGSFSEGAGQGVAVSPSIRGITGVTNPLIEKYTAMLAPKIAPNLTQNPIGNYLTTSLIRGAQNVPEGALIDSSLGRRPLSPESMALDLASGFLPGSPNARGKVNVNANAKQIPMHPDDRDFVKKTLARAVEMRGSADYDIRFRKNDEKQLRELAGFYMNKEFAKKASFQEIAQELFNRAKVDSNEMQFGLPGMGLVGKNQGKVEQVFKTEKFDVGQREVKIIKNLQKQLGLETRDVRTFDEMKAMAEEMGTSPKQLLKDIQSGRITDKEVISLGNVISTSSQRIQKLTNQLKNNPGNQKLQAQLAVEEELINQAIRKRIQGGTEAGRAVAAFRAIANRNLDPSYWLDKAQRQIGDKKELSADVVTAINDYIGKKDRLGLATFVSKLGESSGLEKAVGLWKASLLTGIRTHEANIIGNTAMAGLETIKDIPATGFDMVRSAITRSPRTKAFGVGTITDQFSGAVRGGKNAVEVLKTGVDPQDIAKAEFYKPLRYGNTPLGKAAQLMTNAVFRTLGAEDKIFYGAAYNRSMGEQMRLARINGKAVTEPTEEMIKAAVKDALYSTFTNENALNNAIKGAKQAGGQKVAAAIDVVAPFTRTPTNVAKATFIDYTPVGLIDTVTQKIFSKEKVDNKDLAEAFGRSLTGTAALWLGVELAKRGLVSGASSSKETERSQNELEQQPPNSVFINGAWQSVSKISPLGNLILLGAAHYNSGGSLSETAFAGLKGFSENSFLQGLSNVGKALNEPQRNASTFVDSAISGYIPTLASDIARGIDDVKRKPEGLIEKVQSRIPGLREVLPERLNALGEPVKEQGNFVSKVANPFNSSKPSDDPIVNEFKRVGYNLNYTGDSISIDGVDTKLNRDQEREYQKLAGKYIKQYIPEFINSSGYTSLSKDDQRDMIEKMVNTAKEQAREELKTKLNSIEPDYGFKAGAAGKDELQFTSSNDIPNINIDKTEKTTNNSNKIIYRDGTRLKTIDLSPPSKGAGIGAFANQNWNITKAREVWNAEGLSKDQKDQAFKKLGVKSEDVRYDALAHYSSDEKAQYIVSKSPDKKKLIENLTTGRVRSIGNELVANDGTIDILVDEGYLTKEEAKELKAIDYDKSGKLKVKSGKGKKLKIGTTPKMSAIDIKTPTKMQAIKFGGSSKKLQLKSRAKAQKPRLKIKVKKLKTKKLKVKSTTKE